MHKIITLSIFLFLTATIASGQALQGSDKLYYDQNGKLFTGISRDYFPDSVIHAEFEIKNGELEGISRIYFDDGQLEEIRS